MNEKYSELTKCLDSCTTDAEAIAREIFSLRLELKALTQNTKIMRQNIQTINHQLPPAHHESEWLNVSDCDWFG